MANTRKSGQLALYARALKDKHTEQWWQVFLQKHFLLMQDRYVHVLPKMSISIGAAQIPDFLLVRKDGYLDILEIKTPQTPLLTYDHSRNTYPPSSIISQSIVQAHNYNYSLLRFADPIRSYINDVHNIRVNIIAPQVIILAGHSSQLTHLKQQKDFSLFWSRIQGISICLYDQLPDMFSQQDPPFLTVS